MIYDLGDNDLGDIVDLTNDGDEENGSEEKKAELLQVAMLENEKKEVGANDQINDNTTTNNNMTMNLQTTSNQPTPKLLTPKPPPSPLSSSKKQDQISQEETTTTTMEHDMASSASRRAKILLRDPNKPVQQKWYDEKSDNEVLLSLQETCFESLVNYVPKPPTTKKKPTKAEKVKQLINNIKNRKHIFKPTNRRPILDKRGVYNTGSVPRVYKQKDLKKARAQRMKNVVGMHYSLPDI